MKAILVFDLGGVLMKHNPHYHEQMNALLAESAEDLSRAYETGLFSTEQFLQQIMRRVHRGVSCEQLIAAWKSIHAGIPTEYQDMLRAWKNEGYRLLLLSNNNEIRWQNALAMGLDESLFEHTFLSYEMHLAKPDKRIYQSVNRYIGGGEVYFVDDHALNRQAAEAFGWHTFESIPDLAQHIRTEQERT